MKGKSSGAAEPADDLEQMNSAVRLGVACLGFSAIVTQVVILRECLNVFAGNELVVGLVLGNWLLLTGAGSFLGRYANRLRHPIRRLAIGQAAVAVIPMAQVAAVRYLKGVVLAGLVPGIREAFFVSFALLLPYCLITGFLLTVFCAAAADRRDARQISDVYVLDTVGGVAGGLVFSLILIHFFSPFQTIAFLMILNLLSAAILSFSDRRRVLGAAVAVLLLLGLGILWRTDLERLTGGAMFAGQETLLQKSTSYGNLAVTRQARQLSVFVNGVPAGSTDDPVSAEEAVHYALVQHPAPKVVLLISGGMSGAVREAAKYPVDRIDYVELDPAVIDLAKKIAGAGSDPRMRAIASDARRWLRSASGQYDAILMNLPDPSSAQVNRFYTAEFFAESRRAMRDSGVISLSLSGAENYANPELRRLASSVHRSLATAFPNILVIPGERQFFVASDRALGYDIPAHLKARRIETRYVNADYLKGKLTDDRIAAAREMISATAPENRDFAPAGLHAHLQYWLSQFGAGFLLPAAVVAAISVLLAVLIAGSTRPAVTAAVGASGFAGMGLSVILLIAFQVCYGYVYQQMSLMVTAFLAGSAAGAAWAANQRGDPCGRLFRLDVSLAVASFLLAPVLTFLRGVEHPVMADVAPQVVFAALNVLIGLLAGAQIPAAARLSFAGVEETAGRLYAVDLLGSSLGAILVGAVFIPLFGLTATCYVIGAVKLFSAAALRVRREVEAEPAAAPAGQRVFAPYGATLAAFLILGVLIAAEETGAVVYAISFAPAFHWAVLALLAVGIIRAMEFEWPSAGAVARFGRAVREKTTLELFRWVNFFVFALAVFFPIFRCYFKVPYLFCHVCPRKCVFGFLRPYLVPAALIMNLEKRHWCYHACPIGTMYDCQARAAGRAVRRPAWLAAPALGALIFTAGAYFKLEWDFDHQETVARDWYTFFFINRYAVVAWTLGAAAALIALAFRLRRAFCEMLCPVGTISDLILKLERWFNRTVAPTGRGPAAVHPAARLEAR